MKCNDDCKHFMKIANTEECGIGLCSYPESWTEVKYNGECMIMPQPYRCKDCGRFGYDDACMTCEADDPAVIDGKLCWGFIDKRAEDVYDALAEWKLRGLDWRDKLAKIVLDFGQTFKMPGEEKDVER